MTTARRNSETKQVSATPTTDGRSVVGFIPVDARLSFAESLVLPYQLPRSDQACRAMYGKPGRRVVIHIKAEEFPQ